MTRFVHLGWVVDHLDQVDVDFRRFYHWPPGWGPGVADGVFPEEMDTAVFFRLCEQLKYQEGSAVRGWIENEQAKQERDQHSNQPGAPTGHTPNPPPSQGAAPPRPIDQLALSPAFAGDSYGMPPVIGRMKKRK